MEFTADVKYVSAHMKVIISRRLSNKNLIGNGPNKVAIKDAFHSFIYLLYHLVNLVKEIADLAQIDIRKEKYLCPIIIYKVCKVMP